MASLEARPLPGDQSRGRCAPENVTSNAWDQHALLLTTTNTSYHHLISPHGPYVVLRVLGPGSLVLVVSLGPLVTLAR
jgi:hypothetical protein